MFKGLSLFSKIGLIIASVTVLGASVTSYVFYTYATELIQLSDALKEESAAAKLQGEVDMMHDAIRSDLSMLALFLAAGDSRNEAATVQDELSEHCLLIVNNLKAMEKMGLRPEIQERIKEAIPMVEAYVVLSKNTTMQMRELTTYSHDILRPFLSSFNELTPFLGNISEQMQAATAVTHAKTDEIKAVIFSLLVVQCTLGLVISIGVYFALSRMAPRMMKTHLEAVIGAVEMTKTGAYELGQTSTSLAESASKQAAAVEEMSASLLELNSHMKEGSEHAAGSIDKGASTRVAMERAWESSRLLLKQMASIRSSGAEVSKFTKTIDEVAFQTNILSLNASVEAARAGQAGLGFAIVADEVRTLANKTAQSSKEISNRIQQAISSIEEGERINTSVSAEIETVKDQVEHVDELLNELTQRLIETSEGISQLTAVIQTIDRNTQTIAAASEETASMVHELVEHADKSEEAVSILKKLVGVR